MIETGHGRPARIDHPVNESLCVASGPFASARRHVRGADPMTDTDLDELGPIDYLVIEFPADRPPDGSALPYLVDLVDRGIIKVLDLTFIRRDEDGTIVGVDVSDLDQDGTLDVTLFAEAASGLLDEGDLADAGSVLEPGASAAVLVYENRWAAPFASALRRNGAQLVANGRIPVQAILASIDA
jgi:hypothetical protein